MKLALLAWIIVANCCNGLKIRGVEPQNVHYYVENEQGTFQCIGNPDIVIPYEQVNDDYCDCPDGSDEVGTNACENGRFYCANEGFQPKLINSNLVDDGVCDCCDGSDEQEGVCENTCALEQQKYEEEIRRNNDLIEAGLKVKKNIELRSQEVKNELRRRIQDLDRAVGTLTLTSNQLERQKDESVAQDESKQSFDHIINKLNDLNEQINTQLDQMKLINANTLKLEEILNNLNDNYNHNFNDPAVKQASNLFLDFKSNKKEPKLNFDNVSNLISNIKDEIQELDIQPKNEDDTKGIPFIKQLLASFKGVQSISESSISLSEIEDRLQQVQKDLKSKQRELNTLNDLLAKNFGPNDILRSLDSAISNNIGNYQYSLKLNGDLLQIDSKNSKIKIGTFSNLVFDNDEYHYKLKFNDGHKCWNGPIRSAIVELKCHPETSIEIVSEFEKCEYYVMVNSPLGCFEQDLE